ncbi:MAG: hypothetical protein PHE09_20675 [Oscillospiraceae bacterium]|nr:hypothetical protein [Oscillospiraceae bacterium]
MDTETTVQTQVKTQPQKHQTPKLILAKIGNKDWLLLLLVQVFALALQFVLGLLIGICYALQHKRPDMNVLKSIVTNPAVIMIPTFIAELISFAIAKKYLTKKLASISKSLLFLQNLYSLAV